VALGWKSADTDPMIRSLSVPIAVLGILLIGPRGAAALEGGRPFRPTAHRDFAHAAEVLSKLVAARSRASRNTFCVVGQAFDDGDELAWVHWAEGRALILWEPSTRKDRSDLLFSRRFLRLDRDVVADEAALRGSTYRVTKAWVDGLLQECRAHGERFVLPARRGRRQ
jgi:hypothetical protein